MKRLFRQALFWSCLWLLNSCAPTISLFDQYAYTQVTSIKVDALNLMDSATDTYTGHEKEVKALSLQIQKMIEYEKHRPNNTITSAMWAKLNDPNEQLYGGFINRWKQKRQLPAAFISDQKYLIGRAFDQLAELESKKIKSSSLQ